MVSEQIRTAVTVVAAAGGASRAAFLVASVIGKFMDEKATKDQEKLVPFSKQLFDISGVSGGSLGAVTFYAALADSRLADRRGNGQGKRPCVRNAHDTEWWDSLMVTEHKLSCGLCGTSADVVDQRIISQCHPRFDSL